MQEEKGRHPTSKAPDFSMLDRKKTVNRRIVVVKEMSTAENRLEKEREKRKMTSFFVTAQSLLIRADSRIPPNHSAMVA